MPGETKELRVDIPVDMMRALDAIALTDDMERNKFIVAELEKIVNRVIHKSNLLQSMLKGNPLLSTSSRNKADSVGCATAHNAHNEISK